MLFFRKMINILDAVYQKIYGRDPPPSVHEKWPIFSGSANDSLPVYNEVKIAGSVEKSRFIQEIADDFADSLNPDDHPRAAGLIRLIQRTSFNKVRLSIHIATYSIYIFVPALYLIFNIIRPDITKSTFDTLVSLDMDFFMSFLLLTLLHGLCWPLAFALTKPLKATAIRGLFWFIMICMLFAVVYMLGHCVGYWAALSRWDDEYSWYTRVNDSSTVIAQEIKSQESWITNMTASCIGELKANNGTLHTDWCVDAFKLYQTEKVGGVLTKLA